MKKIMVFFVVLVFLVSACATQQQYLRPSQKSPADFLVDKETCANESGYQGGAFLFGPAIIILPIFFILEMVRANNQKKFERCMVAMGYTCSEGCWNVKPEPVPATAQK